MKTAIIIVAWCALAALGGAALAPAAAQPTPRRCGAYPPVGLKLPSAWRYRPGQSAPASTPHNYVLPPWIALNDEQRTLVTSTPEDLRTRIEAGYLPFQRNLCRKMLPEAGERCDQAAQIAADAQIKRATAYQRFLARQIDQDGYQDEFHRAYLEEQLRQEQLLSEAERQRYGGAAGGQDPFLTLLGWWRSLPPNWKLGDDVISGDTSPEAPPPEGAGEGLPIDLEPSPEQKPGIYVDEGER